MKRILVIGCSGAGKSTFARALRDKLDLPLYHLDRIWHKADGGHISRPEFDETLAEILTRACWIIDGDYNRTLEMRLQQCDTVFLLDYPLEVCLAGVQARIGRPREDMPWQETAFDPEFRQWILDYQTDQKPRIRTLLEQYRQRVQIITFSCRQDAADWLAALP